MSHKWRQINPFGRDIKLLKARNPTGGVATKGSKATVKNVAVLFTGTFPKSQDVPGNIQPWAEALGTSDKATQLVKILSPRAQKNTGSNLLAASSAQLEVMAKP